VKYSFYEHFHEDGHKRYSKHVGGYDDYNIINIHICICACWLILMREVKLFKNFISKMFIKNRDIFT